MSLVGAFLSQMGTRRDMELWARRWAAYQALAQSRDLWDLDRAVTTWARMRPDHEGVEG